MRIRSSHHNGASLYLLASIITLVIGTGFLGLGMYVIEKAENSIMTYETTYIKKDANK